MNSKRTDRKSSLAQPKETKSANSRKKRVSPTNPKKNSSKTYLPLKNFYLTEKMRKIIVQIGQTDTFQCHVCPNKSILQRRSVYGHIKSSIHEISSDCRE